MRASRPWLCACWLLGGCGDEVVGYFDGSASGTGSVGGTGSASGTESGDATATTGDPGFVPPGCYGDDFENGVIDPRWNTWIEADAGLEEVGGVLRLTPPSYGLWDTGVIGAYNYVFPFTNAHVRMRVATPPAIERSVVLFLRVGTQSVGVSIHIAQGTISINASIDDVEQYREDFPVAGYPAWLGLRAEGDLVHFEVSDDGVAFTALTTRDKPAAFDVADALIMAQTYGDDPDRTPVAVDDFEVCVD